MNRLRSLPWPLFAILAVQVVFSLRLIWRNTAFIDEATYLYAGHQMIAHWLHGTPVYDFPTFLSGSPAVYPPLGALADSLGGLTGARLLGLAFVLGSTALLYFTGKRLFGTAAAGFGSAMFASLAGTQFLSAFATYDPMALFLLTLSAYLVIRYGGEEGLRGVVLSALVAPLVLALANATKYSTALWDPIVIALALCAPGERRGASWREGVGRAVRFAAVLVAILAGALFGIGHSKYIQGILYTTVNRSQKLVGMGQAPAPILWHAWVWVGFVVVLAAIGILLLYISPDYAWRKPLLAISATLLLAAVLAPLNQARIGTGASLQKHVVFGAWFGCVIAGYTCARILARRRLWIVGFAAVLAALPTALATQADVFYSAWAKESPAFVSALSAVTHPGSDRYLIQGSSYIPAYYVGDVSSVQWKEAGSYTYTDPGTGQLFSGTAAITEAVKRRVFSLIILNFTSTSTAEPASDYAARDAIKKYGGYRILTTLPPSDSSSHTPYTVWALDTTRSS